MSRILLLGGSGQVGYELHRVLQASHDLVAPSSNEVDLASPDAVHAAVRRSAPQIIINAAAYTTVDRAESEAEAAAVLNTVAPASIAEAALQAGAALIHYSTDYVFDGRKTAPYIEEDTPQPLSVYGRTKLQGERAILGIGPPALIFRTSWIYGLRRSNFLLTMQNLLRTRETLRVVSDQVGAPTWSRAIAAATAAIVAAGGKDTHGYIRERNGIYHMTAGGQTSWYGFAAEIRLSLLQQGDTVADLHPVPTSGYPTPAMRPANSVLNNERLKAVFGVGLPEWRESLHQCLAEQDATGG